MQRKAIVVNNAQADEHFYSQLGIELQFRTESILAAPTIGDGQVLGVIEILNKFDGGRFNITDQLMLGLLYRYAGEAAICSEPPRPRRSYDASKRP